MIKPRETFYDHPDEATEIGYLVMASANFDAWQIPMLANLLGNDAAAMAIIRNIDSAHTKFLIIEEIATASPIITPMVAAVLKHRDAVKAAIQHRNKLCHGVYAFNDKLGWGLLTGVNTAKRGKMNSHKVDVKEIRRHTDALRSALQDVVSVTGPMGVRLPA